MRTRVLFRLALPLAALAAATALVRAQSPRPLVQPANLVYEGSFRVPAGAQGRSTFDYGGTALAYNAAHNSLFMVGFAEDQLVAEISIPAIRKATKITDLATAAMLQPFQDLSEGRSARVDDSSDKIRFGGLLPYNNELVMTMFSWYDGDKSQSLSHFMSGTTFSTTGDVRGPFKAGTVGAGFISGYLASVPSDLQPLLGGPVVSGNCCLNIITRTSYGPALFAIDPADIGVKNPVPAQPLVYYTSAHFVNDWDVQSSFFNGATHVRGVVIPGGTRSVLFFGRHGSGPFCYGEGSTCGDKIDPYKGTHSYPYHPYVWAYDANELAEVRQGKRAPWDALPYAYWQLALPFADGSGDINGAAYDPRTRRLYLTGARADEERPLVHVYTVANATAGGPPPAPGSPRLVR